jgi:predicted esterase YcpF (UPF0227 family)
MTSILYLHGFLSSPKSEKAQQTSAYIQKYYPTVELLIPQIANSIDNAVTQLQSVVKTHFIERQKPLLLIGSSMGGFLSNWLLSNYPQELGGRAVLINPAVAPYNLMQNYLGEHVNPYTQEQFTVDEHHIEVLRELEPTVVARPEHYQVYLQTGDEVLDYRLAEERYKGANLTIENGGDHSFVHYDQHLKSILSFLLESEQR